MSWLSDVGKGLTSSLGSGLISSVFNKHSTDYANALNVKNYSQRYQLAVKDMQAAGEYYSGHPRNEQHAAL